MTIDKSEASRALAKAIACKACGKDVEADQWAREYLSLRLAFGRANWCAYAQKS
jgi:hypothetical protein